MADLVRGQLVFPALVALVPQMGYVLPWYGRNDESEQNFHVQKPYEYRKSKKD